MTNSEVGEGVAGFVDVPDFKSEAYDSCLVDHYLRKSQHGLIDLLYKDQEAKYYKQSPSQQQYH